MALAFAAITPAPGSAPRRGLADLKPGDPQACAVPERHPVLGRACRIDGGWQVLLDDGTTVLTHGPDPASVVWPRPAGVATHAFASTDGLYKPRCVTDRRRFHNRVLYAYAPDRPNMLGAWKDWIRFVVYAHNTLLRREGAEFRVRMDYRILCSKGDVSISAVRLATPALDSNFRTVVDDVRAAGHTSPFAKYWVFYDEYHGGAAGVATLASDDRAIDDNFNNLGPTYGVTFGMFNAGAMMHENGHTLGAVQDSAPNTSGGGHCIDGADVMCYADGGSLAHLYRPNRCRRLHYDCNHNDYFSPKPLNGSYLSRHWNIASPMNRFLSGCFYASGELSVGTGGVALEGTSARTHAVSSSCWQRPFSLSGVVMPAPEAEGVEGRLPFLGFVGGPNTIYNAFAATPLPDFNVCWYRGSTRLKCHTAFGTDRGAIPLGATKATVALVAGARGTYVLNAV